MRNLVSIVFFIVILQGCKSQKNSTIEKPFFDSSFEKFDSEEYSKKSNFKKYAPEDIYVSKDANSFGVIDNNGNVLVNFGKSADSTSGFTGSDYSVNRSIGIYKEYYPNNNIKRKGLISVFGFEIGKWYTYTENGILDSVVDMDAGYDFTYEKVFRYCRKKGIELKDVSGYHLSIAKRKLSLDNNQKIWVIRYPDRGKHVVKVIKLAGNDGSVISMVNSEWPQEHN